MSSRIQSRRKNTLFGWALPLQPLLSAVGGGVVLVLVFLLALVYSATRLVPEPAGELVAVVPAEPVLSLRQRRMVPMVPEISVIPGMVMSGGTAFVSPEQTMLEMEGLVETEPPCDPDFSMLQMELLGEFDVGMLCSELWGTFYDLTRSRSGAPSGLKNGRKQQSLVKKCLNSNDWSGLRRFWRLPASLYSSCFLYPMADAAQLPEMYRWPPCSLPSAWIAAYSGRVVSPVSGTIRFVGTGSTYLCVCFNFRPVLESGSCLASARGDANSRRCTTGAAIKVKEGEVYSVYIILAGSENVADFGLLWEYVSENPVAGQAGMSSDNRYYLFRTNLSTPDDNDVIEAQRQGKKWPEFDPDSPVWMVYR